MINDVLNKLKASDSMNNNETNFMRNHVAFLIKAYTECLRSATHLFDASAAIQVVCLAGEASDIIVQS